MTPERWAEIEGIFGAALEKPEQERAGWLDSACGADGPLHAEVERLLAQNEESLKSPAAPLLAQATPGLATGELLSHYRVEAKVGQGGMGAVYRAYDTQLHRQVALKVLHRELDISEDARTALVNEARAASALDHPNIGTIFGIEDTSDGHRFIVMAYYAGQTLAQKLKNGPVPVKEAAGIALQIASGLAEAHAHKIIHRDIKPSNIFLTRQGLVKIVDFGLARAVRSAISTLSANIPGTATYMSPEQAQGKFLDTRTDLWSLGAVLYEMVTGRRAFAGDSVPATLFAIVHESPPPLGDEIPRTLRKIIYRAIAKQPEERYQSAAEIMQDLRQFPDTDVSGCDPTITMEDIGGDRMLAAASPRPWTKRRYRWLLAPVLMIALVAVLVSLKNPAGPKPAAYQSYLKADPYLQRYEKVENLDQAISLLKQAAKSDPSFALAFASLGDAYRRKFDLTQDRSLLTEAESNASHALQLNDSMARVHVVMGGVHRAFGRRELAQQEYQTACKLEPKNADALSGLAGEYAASQRIPDAERLYRQSVALRPDSWDVYNNFGRFLMGQKKPEEAAEQFRMVIERARDNVAGYQNLAAALLNAGKPDDAEAPLRRAAVLDKSSWAVHINLGDLYFRRRLFPQAERETLLGIKLNDKYWGGWANLAGIYRWWDRDDQAMPAYRRAIPLVQEVVRVQDKNATMWATLAEMYAYVGDRAKASSSMEKALALDPENPHVLLSCADAYEALGDRRLAVEMANKAVANGLRLATLDIDPAARRFRADPDFRPPSR